MAKRTTQEHIHNLFIIIITALLSVIGYYTQQQFQVSKENQQTLNMFRFENYKQHIEMRDSLKGVEIWTKDIYKNIILPTDERSKKNEAEIRCIKEKQLKHGII